MDIPGTTTWVRTDGGWHPGTPPVDRTAVKVWVRVSTPAELLTVAETLGLPFDAQLHRAAGHGRGGVTKPHVDHLDGGGVLLVAPTITYRERTADVLSGEVVCLVLDGVTLTAETGSGGVLDRVAEKLTHPQPLADQATGGVLLALLGTLVATASDVEYALAGAVQDLEDTVFSTHGMVPVEQIYALKREIAEARRGLRPLGTELPELVSVPDDDARADAWVRRLAAIVDRLDGRLDAHDHLLADMLAAHLALVSVRQNDDVRRISSWAAIAAAPTLIASVYGMNFRHMPELSWPWGYPAAATLMVGACVLLYRLFKRSGWL